MSRIIRAPRGPERSTKGWLQEAALRMLMNNLDPEVAENPDELVVYGGRGKAARTWEAFDAIVRTLRTLENDETLLIQSGKPVGVFRTHEMAPRVLIANSLLVPDWATWDTFWELEAKGLMMYGQMTAGWGQAGRSRSVRRINPVHAGPVLRIAAARRDDPIDRDGRRRVRQRACRDDHRVVRDRMHPGRLSVPQRPLQPARRHRRRHCGLEPLGNDHRLMHRFGRVPPIEHEAEYPASIQTGHTAGHT